MFNLRNRITVWWNWEAISTAEAPPSIKAIAAWWAHQNLRRQWRV
ncbi:MAG: hypothetical protein ACTS46_00725 [Candidatus Hodgkinia cicadicola]